MNKFLCISLMVLSTPCMVAMEVEATMPLLIPEDAVIWADALVNSPGHLSKDAVIECFNKLTDEYLPLFETFKSETLEHKIALLNDERKCLVDQSRKLLLKEWATSLLNQDKRFDSAEEKKIFDENVVTCINLWGLVISSDDVPIHIVHRALTTCEDDLRKAKLLLPRIRAEIDKLNEEEVWWSMEHNQLNDDFNAIPKVALSTLVDSQAAPIDSDKVRQQEAILLQKKLLFDTMRQALEESFVLDKQLMESTQSALSAEDCPDARNSDDKHQAMHCLVLLILQRALLSNSGVGSTFLEDDYKVRVAARQLASEEAVKGLEIMLTKTQGAIGALIELHLVYDAKCQELRRLKRQNVVLRARLRRLANIELSHEEETLLQEIDQKSPDSTGCVIA